MNGMDELKDLLDRLRAEVGDLPDKRSALPAAAPRAPEPPAPARPLHERPARPHQPGPAHAARREDGPGLPFKTLSWRENKEMILFGVLCSLIAALAGVLAGSELLIATGSVLFLAFSLMFLYSLFSHQLNLSRRAPEHGGLRERIDAVSEKIEEFGRSVLSSPGGGRSFGESGREEIEDRLSELRALLKTLSKAAAPRK
ncbi:MAG TPA: hypothetical protein PKI19_01935 [Elusimicrobiales bacterium]|nr:hypothetical protein [Elusimicrobiales bacterium]